MAGDLFAAVEPPAGPALKRPLADQLRPATLGDVVGQGDLLGPDGSITRMLARGSLASMIFWGPPGVGKTTIARLLADASRLHFVQLSAVFSGVADLKRVFDEAKRRRAAGQATLLFVDEIHRFNRAQQDGFLPVVEDGTVVLVGATTENPSFALNGALLSRCQVLVLRRLDPAALGVLLGRVEADGPLPLSPASREVLVAMADGDGRYLLNMAEQLQALPCGTAPLGPGGVGHVAGTPGGAVRQGSRRALQPHFRAAQIPARIGPGCGPLLVRPHADRRRGPALHRAPARAFRVRGCRDGRPASAGSGDVGLGDVRASR